MPRANLLFKGYSEGRYALQLFAGNKRFFDQLKNDKGEDKKLSDLDLSQFNHAWTPANIAAGLTYGHWQANGWGYSIIDRSKAVDLQSIDPYTCFPTVAAWLVWNQLLLEASFMADELLGEQLFAQLDIPTANPYTFSSAFREAWELKAGYAYNPVDRNPRKISIGHEAEFAPERLFFEFVAEAPYHELTVPPPYNGTTCHVDTLGYYKLNVTVPVRYGCRGS